MTWTGVGGKIPRIEDESTLERWCLRCTGRHPAEHQLVGTRAEVADDVLWCRDQQNARRLPPCCSLVPAVECGCATNKEER